MDGGINSYRQRDWNIQAYYKHYNTKNETNLAEKEYNKPRLTSLIPAVRLFRN